jgi:hypothetical protein
VSARYRGHCRPGTGAASRKCQPATGATVSSMNRVRTRREPIPSGRSGRRPPDKPQGRCLRTGPDPHLRWWRGRDLNPRPSGYELTERRVRWCRSVPLSASEEDFCDGAMLGHAARCCLVAVNPVEDPVEGRLSTGQRQERPSTTWRTGLAVPAISRHHGLEGTQLGRLVGTEVGELCCG